MLYESDNDVPTYVEDLSVKMLFISRVPPGYKVSIYAKSYLNPSNWATKPLRWIYWEDSNSTCDYVQKIVDEIGQVLKIHKFPDSKPRLMIINGCREFRQGLRNIINTYSDNPITSAKLRTSLSMLNIKVPEVMYSQVDDDIVGTTPVPPLANHIDGEFSE